MSRTSVYSARTNDEMQRGIWIFHEVVNDGNLSKNDCSPFLKYDPVQFVYMNTILPFLHAAEVRFLSITAMLYRIQNTRQAVT